MTEWEKHDTYVRTADPATCRYNGVELPNINKVWTDELKERYPYATILLHKDFGAYTLIFSPSPFNKRSSYLTSSNVKQYSYATSTQTWKYNRDYSTIQFSTVEAINDTVVGLWTNGDIIDETSGSVYLAASDPVPVGGEPAWNGHTFYKVIGNKWVKHDAYNPQGGTS